MQGLIDRPLEPRDIRQVAELPARRELRQEIGELLAVLGEAGSFRQMLADELVRGISEETLAHQAAHHGIGRLERIRQRDDGVIAIDLKARGRIQAVAGDELQQSRLVSAADRIAEVTLYVLKR